MNEVIGRVFKFEKQVFARHADLYGRLCDKGQSPKALMISCADSRIVPELILQAEPGDLFVTRNAGNIVPPFAQANGGVSSAVEYAVMALGVTDLIVCGHSGCGAMEGLLKPGALDSMPNVAAWLRHSQAAHGVVHKCYPDLKGRDLPFCGRRHCAGNPRSARLVCGHPFRWRHPCAGRKHRPFLCRQGRRGTADRASARRKAGRAPRTRLHRLRSLP
jgi:carbonic anhydrase